MRLQRDAVLRACAAEARRVLMCELLRPIQATQKKTIFNGTRLDRTTSSSCASSAKAAPQARRVHFSASEDVAGWLLVTTGGLDT